MWNHVNKLTEKCCEVCGSLYDGTINSKRCSEFCKKQWLQDYYKNKKPINEYDEPNQSCIRIFLDKKEDKLIP